MHEKHLAYINDNNDAVEKSAYTTLRSTVQKKLRGMQEDKVRELQDAADRHDMKAFYHNLRAVYGPRDTGSIPVRSSDGTTHTRRRGVVVSGVRQ